MRTLAITQNITVDGSIEMLGDWFDPQRQGGTDNSDLLAELHRQGREADGLLLGRRTFEDLRGYWAPAVRRRHRHRQLPQQRREVRRFLGYDPAGLAKLDGSRGRHDRSSPRAQGRAGPRHSGDRQHHPVPRAHPSRARRPVPALRVPGRPRPTPSAVPDGVEVPELKLIETKTFRCGITYTRFATPNPRRSRPGSRSASGKPYYHCLSKARRRSVAQGDRSTSSVVRRAQQGPRPHHR